MEKIFGIVKRKTRVERLERERELENLVKERASIQILKFI